MDISPRVVEIGRRQMLTTLAKPIPVKPPFSDVQGGSQAAEGLQTPDLLSDLQGKGLDSLAEFRIQEPAKGHQVLNFGNI